MFLLRDLKSKKFSSYVAHSYKKATNNQVIVLSMNLVGEF
jgi:hypothetical protein